MACDLSYIAFLSLETTLDPIHLALYLQYQETLKQ